MSLRDRPLETSRFGTSIVSALVRAAGLIRSHVEAWPERYIQMRTDAGQ
ncbi:hypothetical protein [Halapricum salinum]|nr:hypothetical protein [Halapricum salinum]